MVELLVVASIISILALLALPNFQDATIRAQVSRARNELRTFVNVVEIYHVDHTKYPRSFNTHMMTTPVAYVTNPPMDPFFKGQVGYGAREYVRRDLGYYRLFPHRNIGYSVSDVLYDMAGHYVVFSRGPDMQHFNGTGMQLRDGMYYCSSSAMFRDYDPTNGTVSYGNLIRTFRDPSQIGVHPLLYKDIYEAPQWDSDTK